MATSRSINPFSMVTGENVASSLPSFAQYFFGNSGAPFKEAGDTYRNYFNKALPAQQPYQAAGNAALPQVQSWLSKMQNPAQFINNLMNQYQQSPWAKYQQDQAMRAATNAASASGLIGSTPYLQFAEQNAHDISSQDIHDWLSNVLGVNTQYGAGQQGLVNTGQHASDILSQLFEHAGETMGQAAYGEEAGKQSDQNALWSGITKLFGG